MGAGENSEVGVWLARVESGASSVNAVSERTWLLTLKPGEDADKSLSFKFPEPTKLVTKAAYKQYSDADIVEVDSKLALAGIVLGPAPKWPWIAGSMVVLLLGFGAWRVTKRDNGLTTVPAYRVPDICTPFAVIDLLRPIDSDQPESLTAP